MLVGYATARLGFLGEGAGPMLSRLSFFVRAPFLLFSVLATADVQALFSSIRRGLARPGCARPG